MTDSLDLLDFYNRLQNQGVQLWVENQRLRYQAPPGALTSRDLETIGNNRHHLSSLILEMEKTAEIRQRQKSLQFLKDKYQACLALRKTPDYKSFSALTKKHERLALQRLERQMADLSSEIKHLTDSN